MLGTPRTAGVMSRALSCRGRRIGDFAVGLKVIWIVIVGVVGVVVVVVVDYRGVCHRWRLRDVAVFLTGIRIWTGMARARLKALAFQGRGICDFTVGLAVIWIVVVVVVAVVVIVVVNYTGICHRWRLRDVAVDLTGIRI
jgi:hypothetical protein